VLAKSPPLASPPKGLAAAEDEAASPVEAADEAAELANKPALLACLLLCNMPMNNIQSCAVNNMLRGAY
jgi:hypothetical protein